MKETFYLTGNTFPRMPVPHDNVISRINLNDQFITFFLDADVDDEDDAIRFYHPEAKSLIIRYHQTDPWYSLYKLKTYYIY